MRARSPILAICAVAALSLLGCDRMNSARDTAAGRGAPAPEVAQVITGELENASMATRRRSSSAETTGPSTRSDTRTPPRSPAGSSVQGLAGREGDRVRVSYRELPPATDSTAPIVIEAIRIEVVPTEQPDRRRVTRRCAVICLRVRAKRDDRVDA